MVRVGPVRGRAGRVPGWRRVGMATTDMVPPEWRYARHAGCGVTVSGAPTRS